MGSSSSKVFIGIAILGIAEAFYHARLESAFSTNIFSVDYSQLAALFGIPYWIFGLVWFPLILLVALWATRFGNSELKQSLLILLTIGNVFTAYMWYLDVEVVKSYHPLYIALYATNYALTGLVVYQNRPSDVMHGYVYGTLTGGVVGLLFGPYGVAACGIAGGIFGAIRNYLMPRSSLKPVPAGSYLEEEKKALERRLKEIESRINQQESSK